MSFECFETLYYAVYKTRKSDSTSRNTSENKTTKILLFISTKHVYFYDEHTEHVGTQQTLR